MLRNRACILITLVVLGFYSFSLAQEAFTYAAGGKRNPFIPLVSKDGNLMKLEKEEKNESDLLVDGIVYDKQGISFALVNGKVARVGDYVGVYRVLKIQADRVAFLKDDLVREVAINKEGDN
jgi:hypothetical protein